MIVKSTQHGGRVALARHVQRADKNEVVEIVGADGLANGGNVDGALMEMQTIAQGSRTKRFLVHGVANAGPDAPMTEEAWDHTWKTYLRQHGLEGHPYIRVRHTKGGWQHEHLIALAVDPVTLKSARLGHLHQKDEAVSRMLEVDFGHRLTNGVHSKAVAAQCRRQGRADVADALDAAGFTGAAPGRGRFTRNEKEASDRGVPIEMRREQIAQAWRSSTDAGSFAEALRAHGLFLAQGDGGKGRGGDPGRAALVAVDADGNAVPVLRSLKRFDDLSDLKKRDLDERIKGLVVLPLAEVKEHLVRAQENSAGIDPEQGKRILDGLAEIAPPTDAELGVANYQAERRARLRADGYQAIDADEPEPFKDKAGRTIYPEKPRSAADKGVFTADDLARIYRSAGFSKTEAQTEARKALETAVADGRVVNLSKLEGGGEAPARYATKSFLLAEIEVSDRTARMRATTDRHRVEQRHIDQVFHDRPTLKEGQRNALAAMLGPESLVMVEGYAGAGKTFCIGAAVESWRKQGLTPVGGALSGVAAKGLHDAGITDSRTLKAWLIAWQKAERDPANAKPGDVLTSKHVLVVDEAAMVGSTMMRDILRIAEKKGVKICLVGDRRQTQSIDPGAVYATMARIAPPATIDAVTRQSGWAKEAVEAFGRGAAGEALRSFQEHGCISETATADQAIDQIARKVVEHKRAHPDEEFLALAYRNDDVAAINQRIRALRIEAGEIEQGQAFRVETKKGLQTRHFAVGDDFLFTGNDGSIESVNPKTLEPFTKKMDEIARLDAALAKRTGIHPAEQGAERGVKNGERGRVVEVSEDRIVVALKDRTVAFDPRKYRKFDWGGAISINRSQGVTVNGSVLYGNGLHSGKGGGLPAELLYVGLSRSKAAAEVIVSQDMGGKARLMEDGANWKPNESALARLEQAGLTRREVLSILSPAEAATGATTGTTAGAPTMREAIERFIERAIENAQSATRDILRRAGDSIVGALMKTGADTAADAAPAVLETVLAEAETARKAEEEAKKTQEKEIRVIFKPAVLVDKLREISSLPPERRAGAWDALAPEILALDPRHAAMLLEEMQRQGMPEKAIERVKEAWVAADPQNRRGQLSNGFVADFLSAGQTAPPAPARRFVEGEDNHPTQPEQKAPEQRKAPKLPPAATRPEAVPPASTQASTPPAKPPTVSSTMPPASTSSGQRSDAGASTIRPQIRDAARVAQLRGVLLGTWRRIPPDSPTSRVAAIQVAQGIGADAIRHEVAPGLPRHEAEALMKAADGADLLDVYARIDRAGGSSEAWSRHGADIERAVQRLDGPGRARVAAVLLIQGDHMAAAHLDTIAGHLAPHDRAPSTVAKSHLADLPDDHRALLYGLAGRNDPTGGDPHNTNTLPGKPGK